MGTRKGHHVRYVGTRKGHHVRYVGTRKGHHISGMWELERDIISGMWEGTLFEMCVGYVLYRMDSGCTLEIAYYLMLK